MTDAQSVAALRLISERLGRRRRFDRNQSLGVRATDRRNDRQRGCGAVVTLICDNGDRYLDTYYSDEWLETNGVEWRPEYERLLELTGS